MRFCGVLQCRAGDVWCGAAQWGGRTAADLRRALPQILVQQPDPADDLSRASSAEETEETRRQYWASVEEAERHAHAVEEEPGIVVVEPDHGVPDP